MTLQERQQRLIDQHDQLQAQRTELSAQIERLRGAVAVLGELIEAQENPPRVDSSDLIPKEPDAP